MSEATPEPPAAPEENLGTAAATAGERPPQKLPFCWQPGCLNLLLIAGGLLFLECAGLPLLSLMLLTLFGWPWFLYHTLPQVSVSWGDVTLGVVVLGLIYGTAHLLARWFVRQKHGTAMWPAGRTVRGVLLVVLMFAAGTAMVAGVHQLAWLVTSEEPLFSPNGHANAYRRTQSKNNQKQIGLAMHNFHDSEGALPAGGTVDAWGTPQHSWVTELLPYLDHARLYEQIDLRRPWTDERNRAALQKQLYMLENPGIRDQEPLPDGLAPSHYAANARVCGLGRGMRIQQMKDGTSYTILAGEISTRIPAWGDPFNFRDPALGINGDPGTFGSPWTGGAYILMGDGSVNFLNQDIDPEVLKALSTPHGGDQRVLKQWREQY